MKTRIIEPRRMTHPIIQYGTHMLGRGGLAADGSCMDFNTALTQPNPAQASEIARCRTPASEPFWRNPNFSSRSPFRTNRHSSKLQSTADARLQSH